jgi:tetratricopeptide (TPR) repeat protein
MQKQVLALEEQAANAQPNNVEMMVAVAGSCCNVARCHNAMDQPAEAVPWYDKAISLAEAAQAAIPKHSTARLFLRNAHWGRAEALERLKRYAEADADWLKAIDLAVPSTKGAIVKARDDARAKRE